MEYGSTNLKLRLKWNIYRHGRWEKIVDTQKKEIKLNSHTSDEQQCNYQLYGVFWFFCFNKWSVSSNLIFSSEGVVAQASQQQTDLQLYETQSWKVKIGSLTTVGRYLITKFLAQNTTTPIMAHGHAREIFFGQNNRKSHAKSLLNLIIKVGHSIKLRKKKQKIYRSHGHCTFCTNV